MFYIIERLQPRLHEMKNSERESRRKCSEAAKCTDLKSSSSLRSSRLSVSVPKHMLYMSTFIEKEKEFVCLVLSYCIFYKTLVNICCRAE